MTKDATTMDTTTMPEDEIIDLLEVVKPGKILSSASDAGEEVDFSTDIESMLEDLAKHEAQAVEPAEQPFPDPTPVNHKVDPDEELDLPDTADFDALLDSLGAKAMPPENGQKYPFGRTGDDLDLPSPDKSTHRKDIPIDIDDLPMHVTGHDAPSPVSNKHPDSDLETSQTQADETAVIEDSNAENHGSDIKTDNNFDGTFGFETTNTTQSPNSLAEPATDSSISAPKLASEAEYAAKLSSTAEPALHSKATPADNETAPEITNTGHSLPDMSSGVADSTAPASIETGQTNMSFTPLRAYTASGKAILPQFMEGAEPNTAETSSLPDTMATTKSETNATALSATAFADLIAYPFDKEISQPPPPQPAAPLASEAQIPGTLHKSEPAAEEKPKGTEALQKQKEDATTPSKEQALANDSVTEGGRAANKTATEHEVTDKTVPESITATAPDVEKETSADKAETKSSTKSLEMNVAFPEASPVKASPASTHKPAKQKEEHISAITSGNKATSSSLDQVDLNELDALLDDMLATAPPAGAIKKGHKPKHRTDMEEEFIPAGSKPSVTEPPLSNDAAQRLQEFEDSMAALHTRFYALEERQEAGDLDFRSVQQKLLVSQSELVEQEVAPLHKALQGAQMQMKELLETLEEKNKSIDSMQAIMQGQEEALAKLEALLQEQSKAITTLEATINNLENSLATQQNKPPQDTAFAALQSQLDKIELTIEAAAAVAAAKVIREEIAVLLSPEFDS